MSNFLVQPAGIKVSVSDVDDCIIQSSTWVLNDWGYIIGSSKKYNGKCLHRVIAKRMGLDLSKLTDHKDCNKTNNRRSNLREATKSQNGMNSKSNNKSGYKGVTWNKAMQKWQAQIQINGRSIHLGYYDYAEQAHLYYCIAAIKHFGEFARFE